MNGNDFFSPGDMCGRLAMYGRAMPCGMMLTSPFCSATGGDGAPNGDGANATHADDDP